MNSFVRLKQWVPLACIGLVLGAAGCGEKRESAAVSGKVTVKGKPFEGIRVSFQPQGQGLGSAGVTDAGGAYTLRFVDNDTEGAALGRHQVMFFDLASNSPGESPDGGAMPPVKTRLPRKFLSESLEYEVKPGQNQADFDLR